MSRNLKTVIIIPSRLEAVRLPQKPLALLCGKPMIAHVVERAQKAGLGDVVVACCSEKIADVAREKGARAVITDPLQPTGTDRIVEALEVLEKEGRTFDIVVNLQGDLPTISPQLLQSAVQRLESHPEFDIMTLVAPFTDKADIQNPNVVKAVLSLKTPQDSFAPALYFSRSPVPHESPVYYYHIGVYVFRTEALKKFVKMPPTLLEKTERLEQLRALEMGLKIGAAIVDEIPVSVDVPDDLRRAEDVLKTRG